MITTKKRILFIGNFLSTHHGTISPSEKIASLLDLEGYEFKLSSNKPNKVLRLLFIIKSISLWKYDIGHVDVFSGQAFRITEVAVWLLRIRKKKIILNLHGGMLPEFYLKKDNDKRFKKIFLKADRIITPSKYLKSYFEEENFVINYLPNFIDTDKFKFEKERKPIKRILWVRAFAKIYNPILAIETLKILKIKYPDVEMTMIGPDKGLLEKVLDLVDKYKLNNNLTITGSIPNDKLDYYYKSHSVFINTTDFESFGVAVLEAMISGIPVVSNKVGELPYLWDNNEDILFVSDKDPFSMSTQIERIFLDNDLRTKLVANAYKKAKEFSWEKIKYKWIQLFSEVGN